ncbi:MAG: rhomboid family intramembrane serine protease [Eubacteriales bacterium]|nr:rhomboid family intramembrane serine protease [Eubacteriales bacterium]
MQNEITDFLRSRKKMNLLLVFANVAVFLAMELTGGDTASVSYMAEHGAMYVAAVVEEHEYYRLFTSMFLHFGLEHLLYNMLLLLFAGDMLESRTGGIRYLFIYLAGGVAGNVLSLAVSLHEGGNAVSAGASGAVFAVIGGLVWLIAKNRGRLEGVNARGVCLMAVLSLAQGFTETGVDNYAHLGGFIGGFLAAAVSEILFCRREEKNS